MPVAHPLATPHLPVFFSGPNEADVLMFVVAVILLAVILVAGVFFFWLHSLPERMVHNRVQFDIVAVLALLSLFTHIHAFWVAALLLALVKIPDFSFPSFSKPLDSIAGSLETMAAEKPIPPVASPVESERKHNKRPNAPRAPA